jgi:putative acetyltransferase
MQVRLAQTRVLRQGVRMRIMIRPMHADDLEALQTLWVAAWQATMPQIDFAARRDWLATHLQTLHEAGAMTLCATVDGTVRGFLAWFPETGLVEQLAVDPAHAGRGIATALLDRVKRERPAGLHLLVNQENPRAVAFYRRAGFAILAAATHPGGTRPLWRMAWPA